MTPIARAGWAAAAALGHLVRNALQCRDSGASMGALADACAAVGGNGITGVARFAFIVQEMLSSRDARERERKPDG